MASYQKNKLLGKMSDLKILSNNHEIAKCKGVSISINTVDEKWNWTNDYVEFRKITNDPKELIQELEVISEELVSQNDIDIFVPEQKLIDELM
jgi:hypothetical protein